MPTLAPPRIIGPVGRTNQPIKQTPVEEHAKSEQSQTTSPTPYRQDNEAITPLPDPINVIGSFNKLITEYDRYDGIGVEGENYGMQMGEKPFNAALKIPYRQHYGSDFIYSNYNLDDHSLAILRRFLANNPSAPIRQALTFNNPEIFSILVEQNPKYAFTVPVFSGDMTTDEAREIDNKLKFNIVTGKQIGRAHV